MFLEAMAMKGVKADSSNRACMWWQWAAILGEDDKSNVACLLGVMACRLEGLER